MNWVAFWAAVASFLKKPFGKFAEDIELLMPEESALLATLVSHRTVR